MDRKKLDAAVQEAKRFLDRVKALPKSETYTIPGSTHVFERDYYPREQGAVRRASMDLTRALADLRKTPQ